MNINILSACLVAGLSLYVPSHAEKEPVLPKTDTSTTKDVSLSSLTIGLFNVDACLAMCEEAIAERKKIEAQLRTAEAKRDVKMKAMNPKIKKMQSLASTMNPKDAAKKNAEIIAEIQKIENEFTKIRQSAQETLFNLNNGLTTKIKAILDEHARKKNIDIILHSHVIVWFDENKLQSVIEKLDLTKLVVDELNAQYAESKKKTSQEKK